MFPLDLFAGICDKSVDIMDFFVSILIFAWSIYLQSQECNEIDFHCRK